MLQSEPKLVLIRIAGIWKKIETDTCIVFVRDGGGVASPIKSLLSTFSLKNTKKEKKTRKSHIMNTLNRGCGGGGWGGGHIPITFLHSTSIYFTPPPKYGGWRRGGGLIIIQFSICRFEKEKVCRGTHHPSPTRT